MGKLIPRILKELISPGNHLGVYFIILICSICTGYVASHFFKGNKKAQILENYAEKIIEHETGIVVDFDDSSDDEASSNIPIHEFRYPSYQMDFKRGRLTDLDVKN